MRFPILNFAYRKLRSFLIAHICHHRQPANQSRKFQFIFLLIEIDSYLRNNWIKLARSAATIFKIKINWYQQSMFHKTAFYKLLFYSHSPIAGWENHLIAYWDTFIWNIFSACINKWSYKSLLGNCQRLMSNFINFKATKQNSMFA